MSRPWKVLCICLLSVLMLLAPLQPAYAGSDTVTKKETFHVGDRIQLKLSGVKRTKVRWKSSNKKIATVNRKGIVRCRKKGTVKIRARYEGYLYVYRLRVKN